VDKSSQQMAVSVDGVPRYTWSVSTGRAGYGTPSGTYHPQRLEKSWFSREYYSSPMPHSIFFHGGYAIHGSYEINRLGGPASHGCIRLHPANAATLFALVASEGMGATTIVVSGQGGAAVARQREPAPDYAPAQTEPAYRSGYTPYRDGPWGSYEYRRGY
jgi:lipoprotein-anchoring transpeptidase ErfK/SrfK